MKLLCCSLARVARLPQAFRQTINAPTHLAALSNRGFAKDVRLVGMIAMYYNFLLLFSPVRFGGEVRAEMLKGVNVLADAVAVSFCVNISTRKDLIKIPCSAGDHGPQG